MSSRDGHDDRGRHDEHEGRYSSLATPTATRELLSAFGIDPKRWLGQNFLVNDAIVGKICALADLAPDQLVLEVGPGIGTLTLALVDRCAGVVAVERDESLVPVLAQTAGRTERLRLIVGDALALADEQVARASESLAGPAARPTALVANLPYAVAATVLLDYLQRFEWLASATVMVQAEVADRIAARPGTKEYGAYTVQLALVAQVTGRFEVGPGNFMPAPHVDSAVVRLDRATPTMPDGTSATPAQVAAACLAAKAAFAQRRKNIRNSMKGYLASRRIDASGLDAALAQAEVDPKTRGETLDPACFLVLGQALIDHAIVQAPSNPT